MDELTEYLTNSGEDGFWEQIQSEARHEAEREPVLASFLFASVLGHKKLEDGLSVILANKLHTPELPAILLRDLINDASTEMFRSAPRSVPICWPRERETRRRADTRNRSCTTRAFTLCRRTESHTGCGSKSGTGLAAHLQNRISEAFGVDVHPAARIGSGVLIDHGTSVVIGETAVVEDNVSLLHEVTLGGTGKESGDRHPKVRRGVLIGAGAKILGNIEIGIGAKVAACSVVLRDVPPHTTVAGIPARVVGRCTVAEPGEKWTRPSRIRWKAGWGFET